MKDKFNVNFDALAQTFVPAKAHRLADVEGRIEKVAYDLCRVNFPDNADTDQLWKIQEGADGSPVIVALYGDDGGLSVESEPEDKTDWEAVPDKTAMHIYYKGEPLVSLSAKEMGIPEKEMSLAARWLPKKLASDEELQKSLFKNMKGPVRKLTAQRFPELTKVAGIE